VLVHAAAGGVGHLLVQWLKHLGAWVVGTVSSEEKAASVLALGADAAINYGKSYDFLDQLLSLTAGEGVNLAFDSVGKETLPSTVRALARGGTAVACGWSSTAIHREAFSATPPVASDTAFTVRLARSGRQFDVPSDQTVLDVLRDGGVDVEYSCEQGVCGVCLVRVLHGQPDHRDMFLTDEERAANDQFTPCCSRSLSRELVLDL
jgi:NADPH:quinone reductase-like Zn-dependent oxidoreductase